MITIIVKPSVTNILRSYSFNTMYVLRKIKMFDSLTRTNVIISNRNYFFEKLKIKQKKTRAVL